MKKKLAKGWNAFYSCRIRFRVRSSFALILSLTLLFSTVHSSSSWADIKKESVEEYRLKGYDAQQLGHWDEALSFYIRAASLAPTQPQILNDIGVLYEQLGLPQKAQAQYQAAIDSDPEYLPAYMNLAYLYERQGDYVRTLEYLNRRIQKGHPQDEWTLKAQVELERIQYQIPYLKEKLIQAQRERLMNDLEIHRRKEFEQTVVQSMNLLHDGKKFEQANQWMDALSHYDRALEITPHNPQIVDAKKNAEKQILKEHIRKNSQLAIEKLESGDNSSARDEIRELLTVIPNP